MHAIRTALLALLVALPLSVVVTPAHAAGKTCRSTSLAERCADLTNEDGSILANARVTAKTGRVRVRIVSVSLQYRMDIGWVNSNQSKPPKTWVRGGDSYSTGIDCDSAADGRWRSKAVAQWKRGRDGKVHTGRVTSDPVSRARLCG